MSRKTQVAGASYHDHSFLGQDPRTHLYWNVYSIGWGRFEYEVIQNGEVIAHGVRWLQKRAEDVADDMARYLVARKRYLNG